MLQHANIGKLYWKATIGKIPAECSYKQDLIDAVAALPSDERVGRGRIFLGKYGRGKTSASAIMLKSAMARGGQAFHYKATALEKAFEKRWLVTSEGVPIWDMLTKSQLVTIDDFGSELVESGYKSGDTRIVEELIRDRIDDRLTTYITSNLTVGDIAKNYPSLRSILLDRARFLIIKVEGHDWRS
jgi:DNA replication protein DnaC